jgi:hypothetical protein
MPLEKMIKTAIVSSHGQIATKNEIVSKIKETFFVNQPIPNEETWRNSLTQLLSSSRQFKKIKGTYTLRSPQFANNDITQAKTMKAKIIFVLSILPEMTADVNMIRRVFQEYFKEIVINEKEKNLGSKHNQNSQTK